jgi:uncharacterized protein YjdB
MGKRVLSALLALCMVFSYGSVVGAKGLSTSVEIGSAEGMPGDAVDVAVTMDPGGPDLLHYKMDLTYDPNVLELASGTAVVDESSANVYSADTSTVGTIKVDAGFFGDSLSYLPAKQKVLTIKFKIKSSEATGDSPITMSSGSYSIDDSAWNPISSSTPGKVTVKAAPAATSTIGIGEASGSAGQSVDVPVTLTQASVGVGSYGMKIDFDKTALEVSAITGNGGEVFDSNVKNDEGWLKVAWVDQTGGGKLRNTGDKLFTITFKIKDDATLGDKSLNVAKQNEVDSFTFTDGSSVEMTKTLTAGKVTVAAPVAVTVTGVVVSPTTLSLLAGGAPGTLSATVSPDDAVNKNVTWTSSDATVATVTYGVVTPVAAGTATITATTEDGGKTASATVTVAPPAPGTVAVTGVALDQQALNLVAGGATGTLIATVTPVDATNKNVTWTSSDATVATVTYGVVTPVAAGTATITATTEDGGKTASATVTVAPPAPGTVAVTGVALDQQALNLVAGGATGTLIATVTPVDATNKNVTWTSSDATVATVTYGGVVTPIAAGKATITATTADGGKTATATVTVSSLLLAPIAPTNLTATPGDGIITLKWDSVTGATYYDIYQSLSSGAYGDKAATVSGSVYSYIAKDLANNLRYYFTVKAGNAAGVSGASNEASTLPIGSALPGPSSGQAPSGVDVLVNGKAESAGTAKTETVNGRTVTTITVDPQKLDERLAAAGNNAVITIPVNTGSDVVIGVLTGQMVKNMENKQAIVEIKSDNASYTLPAQQINIDALSAQFGANVELKDIQIQIQISKPSASAIKVVENAAEMGNFTLVVPPVEFTVSGTYNNKTVEVSKFNAYVERTIAIPDGVDPSKITTAVVVDPDGSTRHVPTKVVKVDGKYYAKINSLTNSTYSVVWHPLEFSDVANHWAKSAVNDMGSRMVIDGTETGKFSPDRDITRAEFAAIVVRGLGLKLENGKSAFSDVKTTDWYSGAVNTAATYHLIDGLEDGTFHPNDNITREQAMAIVSRAMTITGLKAAAQGKSAADILRAYTDAADASQWAQDGIAASVSAGIISGRDSETLAPQANITRAEVAAMIQRLLQKSGLI